MVASKQWITHQYLLLDVTGALKNVSNILSLFDIFNCPHSIVVHAPHLPILYFPLMCTVIHHFLSIWSSHQAALCMLTSPCVSPACHTALVCMLAVHDTVCTLLQRTAGQGYWTYIVAKKKWGVLYVWWRQKSGWHYPDRMLHSAYRNWIYQISVW